MDLANQLILLGSSLLLLSIFVGLVSSRIGAPLLLVFLALGMVFGEDGPGGIDFDNYHVAYLIGSLSLAIILFDGGLRTELRSFRIAAWPALLLATVGVVLTALMTGAAVQWLLGLDWLESFLVGAIVASTDAAAVFFLLRLQGLDIKQRVRAVLEVESGLNDPMAIFLTIGCVELLQASEQALSWWLLVDFLEQIAGGAVIGLAAGFIAVRLINRLDLAAGLYPVFAFAFALFTFGIAQQLGSSGFLAVYLLGLVIGNRRHRAAQLIDRFHDGLAWLAQMVMFVMLGLLVTPSELLPILLPAILIALFLIVIARPLAVVACLLPFRFTWQEHAFVSWVGLRGAVAIFLGTIPVLAGLENASLYFEIAFVVVLMSMFVQGWMIARAARLLDLELPPSSAPAQRIEIDLPASGGRDMMIYTVDPRSRAVGRGMRRLLGIADTSLLGVTRDGKLLRPRHLDRLEPGDAVLVVAPPKQAAALDDLFSGQPTQDSGALGEFAFDGELPIGKLAEFYEFSVPEPAEPVGEFVLSRLHRDAVVGDRLRWESIELVVRGIGDGRITKVGIDLEPANRLHPALARMRRWWLRLRRLLGRGERRVSDFRAAPPGSSPRSAKPARRDENTGDPK